MQDYQILLCKNIHTEEDDASKNLNYDFSNNKVVDTEDVRKLLQYINTPYELSSDVKEKIEAYGDINNDGLIDEKDAEELLKIASGSHTKKHFFKEEAYCELGSSSSSFLGKAIDPVFYTKIDGTHELSFSLPSRYLDEGTGEEKENELVNYLTNKDRIRLKKWNNKKQDYDFFSLVVNDTVEKNDGKNITYQYSCTDAFIEELSKTGYNLIFKEEVGENSGFGTIHELAEKILKGTDWHYNKEKTGTLLEYTTDIEYKREQFRYDTVYTPVPVHPLEYIEELERYCNKLDTKYTQSKYGQIYCYEDTKQVTSNTVQNILYNANEPVEVSGWTTYNKNKGKVEDGLFLSIKEKQWSQEDGEGKHYCLSISGGSTANSYLMNDTAAVSNQLIRANQPYVFRFTQAGYDPTVTNAKILSLEIYRDNPLTNILAVPVYSYSPTGGISPANWHIIKTKVSVTTPYIVFKVQSYTNKPLEVYTFNLYEVKGIETRDGNNNILKSAEENNLYLLSTLTDGKVLTKTSTELSMMCSIENPKLTAYTQKEVLYFHIDNGDVKYLDFEDEVIDKQKISIATKDKEAVEQSRDIDTSLVYRSSKDKRYYQFYTVTRNGRTGKKWDLALFGDGAKDKRRTLAVEKSNRFNLLQELAELFKAWCVFNISEREDGTLKKEIWFKENSINTNFSGFHAGVNLQSLERKSDSNEIVTKMFVENQEKDFVDDGVVTITKAELNPWGENYFYNFKYYINQQLLNSTVNINGVEKLKVEYDLEKLYSSVKTSNLTLKKNNEKLVQLNSDLRILQIQQKSLGYCIAGQNESIASLKADLNRTDIKISEPDKIKIEKNIKNHANQLTKYRQELAQIKDRISGIEVDIKILNQQNNSEQSLKESLILDFEREYAPYIKEGIWSDSSYVDNDSYFLDAQKVSNTSSMPATDWSISVLDGSVIKDLEDFTFSVGDLTILVDNDFFKIKNNPTKNYVFEVLISGIEEHLDNGLENKIEVRNYLTSFEDIFQRVSAATQTLELKEPIYNKAAYFTPDHQVDQGILQNTLLNNQLTLANSSDNSYTLDSSGLSLQSIINPAKKVRLIADGMFFSNSVNIFTGDPIWKTGITAEGINASLLTAGEINTSLVKIYSDNQPRFSWGELGITAYSLNDITGNSFIRLDTFGIYAVENKIGFNYEGAAEVKNPWFEGLSNEDCLDKIIDDSIFSLTERGFNFNVGSDSGRITLGTEGDGYGLYIKDSSGENIVQLVNKGNNKIAGWSIDKYRLQSIEDSSVSDKQNVFYLNSNLSNKNANALAIGQVTKNASSYNEANFRVTVGGELRASGAEIEGTITAKGLKRKDVDSPFSDEGTEVSLTSMPIGKLETIPAIRFLDSGIISSQEVEVGFYVQAQASGATEHRAMIGVFYKSKVDSKYYGADLVSIYEDFRTNPFTGPTFYPLSSGTKGKEIS